MKDEQISKNFKMSEFACKDGSEMPTAARINIKRLVTTVLQPLRDKVGTITIVSGYRSPAYNRAIGGARHSQHLEGTAADIRVAGKTPKQVADLIEEMFNPGGLGRYKNFTHVDIRAGRKARWGKN